MARLAAERVQSLVAESADLVDPHGENESVNILTGLVHWALAHWSEYAGWDQETAHAAIRENWKDDPEYAEEMWERIAGAFEFPPVLGV